jgi:hypothetical protein
MMNDECCRLPIADCQLPILKFIIPRSSFIIPEIGNRQSAFGN